MLIFLPRSPISFVSRVPQQVKPREFDAAEGISETSAWIKDARKASAFISTEHQHPESLLAYKEPSAALKHLEFDLVEEVALCFTVRTVVSETTRLGIGSFFSFVIFSPFLVC